MKHHGEAIKKYLARVVPDPEVLGVILSGSLARGTERDDSDIDLYLIVTEGAWGRALAANRIMIVETEGADYDRGYFDIKLATLNYLDEASDHGDDPVRDSFATARVLWSRVPGLDERVARAGRRDGASWLALEDSFLAQARLHGGYFLHQADASGDAMLLHHAAVHLATAACRALLARHHVLFRGPKYLTHSISALPPPAGWGQAVADVLTAPSREHGDRLLGALEAVLVSSRTFEDSLSTFVIDDELAWRTRLPPPEYR